MKKTGHKQGEEEKDGTRGEEQEGIIKYYVIFCHLLLPFSSFSRHTPFYPSAGLP